MIDPEEAVTAYLADEGRPLTVGGVSGFGVLRGETVISSGGEELYFAQTILGKASHLKELKYGDVLVFNGESYKVQHDPYTSSNTGFCRVPVSGPLTAPIPALRTGEGGRIIPLP